mgnify:CR=1 FL=1
MNFPTANILPHNEIYPLKGVYVVKVKFENKTFKGIANFGVRPTVEGEKLLLEAHLFDFKKDIYGNEKLPYSKVGKLIVPTEDEIKLNNRARSAKLRIAEKN